MGGGLLDFCFQICSELYLTVRYITIIDKHTSHSVRVQLRNRFTVRNMKKNTCFNTALQTTSLHCNYVSTLMSFFYVHTCKSYNRESVFVELFIVGGAKYEYS